MKSLRFLCLGVFLTCFSAVSALAGNSCYNPAQLQAEQLLRLHSELMVIAVTCRNGSNGEPLPAAYGDFTKKNINALHNAEQTMIGYYRQTQKGNPVSHLDRLRTILGNEFGQKAADMTAPAFCAQYQDKVLKFDAATPADVENEAERMGLTQRTYAPSCAARKGT